MAEKDIVSPKDIAKYFLLLAQRDGDLITPLKMQKMVYFAYAVYLLDCKGKSRLFQEKIEAWPSGPVVPSLYRDLKQYGSSPIKSDFVSGVSVEGFIKNHSEPTIDLLNETYDACQRLTAFELVKITHNEKSWIEARKGLAPHEKSNNSIEDKDILIEYVKEGK